MCHNCSPERFPKKNRIVYPEMPANRGIRCYGDPEPCKFEQEEECPYPSEPLDMSEVRYRIKYCDPDRAPSKGLETGIRLDLVIEDLVEKTNAFHFLTTPQVPGRPDLKTFQAIISDLYGRLIAAEKEIENLKQLSNDVE